MASWWASWFVHWIVQVDLAEPSHLVTDVLRFLLEKTQTKSSRLTMDFVFEPDLGASKKAHSHLGLSNRGEPARHGIRKLRRNELVANLRQSGGNFVQTIVAHGRGAPISQSPASLFHY